jgi:hypothetical protein
MSATLLSHPHGARNQEQNENNINHFQNIKSLSSFGFSHFIPIQKTLNGGYIAKPKILALDFEQLKIFLRILILDILPAKSLSWTLRNLVYQKAT